MNRSTMRAFGVVGVVAFGLAGCSGDDDASPTTVSTTDVTTTTVSTTVAATEPTDPTTTSVPSTPATTEPVSTTQPETTTPPTTLPDGVPPRVTFPDDPELQAIVDALYLYLDAAGAASEAPASEVLVEELLDLTADPLSSRLEAFIADLVTNGEIIVPNPDQPTYTQVYAASAVVVDDGASLDVCAVDADIRIRPGGSSDGTDEVINDTLVSVSLTYSFVRDSGQWKVSDLSTSGRWEGQIGCE